MICVLQNRAHPGLMNVTVIDGISLEPDFNDISLCVLMDRTATRSTLQIGAPSESMISR